MKARHLCAFLLLVIPATPALYAADPAPVAKTAVKTGEKPPDPGPAIKLPDLAVTKFTMNTEKVDRNRTILHIRVENIGAVPSARTGLIVDCRLPDKNNQHCLGNTPPPRFHLPALAVGGGRNFTVPLRRLLPQIGKKDRHELRARVDTGVRVQDSNRYNNFRKLEIIY